MVSRHKGVISNEQHVLKKGKGGWGDAAAQLMVQ